jgi:hypothetical protein
VLGPVNRRESVLTMWRFRRPVIVRMEVGFPVANSDTASGQSRGMAYEFGVAECLHRRNTYPSGHRSFSTEVVRSQNLAGPFVYMDRIPNQEPNAYE